MVEWWWGRSVVSKYVWWRESLLLLLHLPSCMHPGSLVAATNGLLTWAKPMIGGATLGTLACEWHCRGCCCRGCFRGRCRGRCHGCCRRPVLLFIDFHYIFLLFFFPLVDPFGVIFLKKKYQKKAFFESKTIFVSYQNHSKPVQCWACIFWMYGRKKILPSVIWSWNHSYKMIFRKKKNLKKLVGWTCGCWVRRFKIRVVESLEPALRASKKKKVDEKISYPCIVEESVREVHDT